MKPTEIIGNCHLYLGDCREILPSLPKVDLVLTDPPYGIGRDGKPQSTSSHGGHKGYEFMGWDNETPDADLFELIRSISKDQIIWGGNYYPQHLAPSMGWLVWDKGQRIDQSDCELAYTSFNKALRSITLNRAAIATDGAVHPTQKPVYLIEWSLNFAPKDTLTVADPFMGSGTTGVACANMGQRSPHFLCVPLCQFHHTGAGGVHGLGVREFERRYKLDELDLLSMTIRKLSEKI